MSSITFVTQIMTKIICKTLRENVILCTERNAGGGIMKESLRKIRTLADETAVFAASVAVFMIIKAVRLIKREQPQGEFSTFNG